MSLSINRVSDLPDKPGVYFFKAGTRILYIGKARNLKKRVSQYFQNRGHGLIQNLLSQATDIEYIVTEDEPDALLLEYNLVHTYQPPFNIRLKDDKSFPLIEITTGDPVPGIYYTRESRDTHFYIGPIVDSRRTRELIDLITRIFKLRTCSDNLFNQHTGCLYYYIDRCSAPCIDKISLDDYREQVDDAVEFLKGNKTGIMARMGKDMMRLADALQFEEAQKIKEDLELVNRFVLNSYISSVRKTEYDVINLHHDPERSDYFIILFSIVDGRVKRKEFFNFDTVSDQKEEILKDFLVSFYRTENIPREILVPFFPDDRAELEALFSQMAKRHVAIRLPLRGNKRKMMHLAAKNLHLYTRKNNYKAVADRMQDMLHLQRFPYWIEGFDISHFSERDRVGAAVVFENGEPNKKKYRNYLIRDAAAGDTEALKEVLERRFRDKTPEEQPDLLLIDGGKGQLSAALSVKEKLGLQCDVIALAKEEERLFLESGGSVIFPEDWPERFLVQNIRDEVHRRAITHHRKRRQKNLF